MYKPFQSLFLVGTLLGGVVLPSTDASTFQPPVVPHPFLAQAFCERLFSFRGFDASFTHWRVERASLFRREPIFHRPEAAYREHLYRRALSIVHRVPAEHKEAWGSLIISAYQRRRSQTSAMSRLVENRNFLFRPFASALRDYALLIWAASVAPEPLQDAWNHQRFLFKASLETLLDDSELHEAVHREFLLSTKALRKALYALARRQRPDDKTLTLERIAHLLAQYVDDLGRRDLFVDLLSVKDKKLAGALYKALPDDHPIRRLAEDRLGGRRVQPFKNFMHRERTALLKKILRDVAHEIAPDESSQDVDAQQKELEAYIRGEQRVPEGRLGSLASWVLNKRDQAVWIVPSARGRLYLPVVSPLSAAVKTVRLLHKRNGTEGTGLLRFPFSPSGKPDFQARPLAAALIYEKDHEAHLLVRTQDGRYRDKPLPPRTHGLFSHEEFRDFLEPPELPDAPTERLRLAAWILRYGFGANGTGLPKPQEGKQLHHYLRNTRFSLGDALARGGNIRVLHNFPFQSGWALVIWRVATMETLATEAWILIHENNLLGRVEVAGPNGPVEYIPFEKLERISFGLNRISVRKISFPLYDSTPYKTFIAAHRSA